MEVLRESIERAILYQDKITDTHFIIGHSSDDFASKSKELTVASVENDRLLALGKPYEEAMVSETESLSQTSDRDTFEAKMERRLRWRGLTPVEDPHYFNDDQISIRSSYGDEGLTPGYIVRLHQWIYRVAENIGLKPLQLTFLCGHRKTVASTEEFIAASAGKQISKPHHSDDSYLNLHTIRAANSWLRTKRCSFNDDLESLLNSIQSGNRDQNSLSVYIYKMLNESEMKRMEHELSHPMAMFKRVSNPCPYFYDILPQIQPRKPHARLIGRDRRIVAQDNSDYIYARSVCHRETFTDLSQEFTDLKII